MLRKCRCGCFKYSGHRWRVLKRSEPGDKSLLKCLACNHKWQSRMKYVSKLQDHQEKSRTGMTDSDILKRLKDKSLIADSLGRFVISFTRGSKHLDIWERSQKGSSYRFVTICHDGKKKKIAIHRLVWMAHHLQTVPDGFDVDHVRGRGIEHPDGIDNLRLLPMSLNRSRKTDEVF